MIDDIVTLSYLDECFVLDAANGVLIWRERPASHFEKQNIRRSFNTKYAGSIAGTFGSTGRRMIRINGKHFFSYRLIYAMSQRVEPSEMDFMIDHADGDHSNDRPHNLRAATAQQNQFNRRGRADKHVGMKGASKARRGRWRASISVGGKFSSLGEYATKEEAAKAYAAAAAKLHGDFAKPL